mgnify:CR=1 FL=1
MIGKILMTFSAILIALTFSIASQVSAITPTPAPTKTPSAESTEEPGTDSETTDEEDTETVDAQYIEPYTQADLSVLTGNVQRPNAAFWHNDKLYTVCNGDWTLYELEDDTGSTITYSYGVRNGHTLYAEGESTLDLFIPDYDVNALVQVTGGASPITIADQLEGPWGIAYLDEENFLVTTLLGNQLLKISRDGDVEELVTGFRSPTGVALSDEYVFVANNGSARRSIEWLPLEELGSESTPEPLVSGLQNTTGIVYAEDGNLYFAYAVGTRGVVGRVDPEVCIEQGGCTNDQVEIVLYTELAAPLAGLTISPDMRLFVHTIYRPEIYWVDIDQSN